MSCHGFTNFQWKTPNFHELFNQSDCFNGKHNNWNIYENSKFLKTCGCQKYISTLIQGNVIFFVETKKEPSFNQTNPKKSWK